MAILFVCCFTGLMAFMFASAAFSKDSEKGGGEDDN